MVDREYKVRRRASAPKPTEYTSQIRIMYRVDICFISVVLGEDSDTKVAIIEWDLFRELMKDSDYDI